jgi:Ca2+-binding RTX toxin-like protein
VFRSMRRTAMLASAVLAAAIVGVPSAASAAPQNGLLYLRGPGGGPFTLHFAGLGDTANGVAVFDRPNNVVEFNDTAMPIDLDLTVRDHCTQPNPNNVRCDLSGWGEVTLSFWMGDGNDVVTALDTSRTTVIRGEAGNDLLVGGQGTDQISGGVGTDDLYGSGGNDALSGEADRDTLQGGDGADRLYGDAGDDVLQGEADGDSLYGGEGWDTLYGNAGGDYLTGEGGVDKLYGGEGTDTLKGDGNGDEVRGGPNNDTLLPGSYGDYYGEGDIDTVDYSAWGRAVRVSLDNRNNERSLPECDDIIGCPVVNYHNVHDDVENVIGTSRNDEIKGSGAANGLYGRGGNDTIRGEAGNDRLDAGEGTSQKLYGGVGSDTCVGSGTITYDSCELR